MIDKLKISIPFKKEFLLQGKANSKGEYCEYVDIKECSRRGISLEAKTVHYTGGIGEDAIEVADLRHPYDSLPTSYTGVAFKIFQGTKLRVSCVELKASPAKIIQGHNVYGSTNIAVGAMEMILSLYNALPDFYEMLDVENALLDAIDCTFSARVDTELKAKQVINHLKNISNKQMRAAVRNEHETTCYFSRGSRHVDRKAYLKAPEFSRQLRNLRSLQEKGDRSYDNVIDVMSNPKLISYTKHLVRFEAGIKRRYLDEQSIPKKLVDVIEYQKSYEQDGKCLIKDLWQKAFKPLQDALEGQTMNIFTDEKVEIELKKQYFKVNPSGRVTYPKAEKTAFFKVVVASAFKPLVFCSLDSAQLR